ncbi:MAG: response regulator [Verrucomicrobia bacterium]|nr:response regulator [Cytophagales bacterium]
MADDDADDRMLTLAAFEDNNILHPLFFVEDGVDLMDYLLRTGRYTGKEQIPTHSLILLDLNMPKKDGRQALKEIKSNDNLKSIPIIILTTSKAEKDILETYTLGANCYITKPVSFEGLMEVTQHISKFWLEIATIPNSRA